MNAGGRTVLPWQARAAFARRLSEMYGREVPAYNTLVAVAGEVNGEILARDASAAQRLGSFERVTAERHGAIRIGTTTELRQVAQIFAAMGMHPVGFYDLRDAAPRPIPVVSTAFRPVEGEELARNPFRVFTSLLVVDDRRFFDADLQAQLDAFLAGRTLFPPELLGLAVRAESAGGFGAAEAERFLDLATAAFELSKEPVDRDWYRRLELVSEVAADIGGVRSTHINHLTPRVLEIDELYRRMERRGIKMIDEIQGPPTWDGPDLLLRQTSFRALAEARMFRTPGGRVEPGELRVRFGEVEARGIALTRVGRDWYDTLVAETDRRFAAERAAMSGARRADVARAVWAERVPRTEAELARYDAAAYTYRVVPHRPLDGQRPPADLAGLLDGGWISGEPIVYEDFLPRSAAGIFSSNLGDQTAREMTGPAGGAARDAAWLSAVLDRPVLDPVEHYTQQRGHSLREVADQLGLGVAPGAAPIRGHRP